MRARPPRTGTTTKWQMHKEIQKKEARGAGRGARSGRTKVMQGGSGLRSMCLSCQYTRSLSRGERDVWIQLHFLAESESAGQ